MARHSARPVVNMILNTEEVEQLDEFRFAHRFPSRAAAMKYLMFTRLEQAPAPTREEWQRFDPHPPIVRRDDDDEDSRLSA